MNFFCFKKIEHIKIKTSAKINNFKSLKFIFLN